MDRYEYCVIVWIREGGAADIGPTAIARSEGVAGEQKIIGKSKDLLFLFSFLGRTGWAMSGIRQGLRDHEEQYFFMRKIGEKS